MTETTIDRYVEFWNADTRADQLRLASATFTEDVSYHAPVGILAGAEALMDFRDQFVGRMGAATLVAREAPQIHHDRARLPWEIRLGDGASFATGTDTIALDEDGRISAVTSFLDRAPEGFDPQAHHA